jgi:transposase InsO family protein
MILGAVREAVERGASESRACEVVGVSSRTLQRWRGQGIGDDNRAGPKAAPAYKLSDEERQEVLSILNSEVFCDLSPWQVVAKLADTGLYVASESTMYRILHAEDLQKHRERSREPQKRHRPKELVANGPNQVWSWDITYLASPVRGAFFYLYMITDVFSRKVVDHAVHDCECGELASLLLDRACRREGVDRDQLIIHSDNGGPMKSATLHATLLALGVATSFSRPRVSNDNPFSESTFRTMKYRPEFPRGPFASLEAAREWVEWFVDWYNTQHQHSGIRFVTPDQRHRGLDVEILQKRRRVYAAARARRPERWSGKVRDWSRIEEVRLNPDPGAGAGGDVAA